jgi:hypothetical protein
MSVTRIYVVLNGEDRRLVDAASAAQAIRHCVKNKYSAKAATPKEIAQYMKSGLQVETASEEPNFPNPGPQAVNAATEQQPSHTY